MKLPRRVKEEREPVPELKEAQTSLVEQMIKLRNKKSELDEVVRLALEDLDRRPRRNVE